MLGTERQKSREGLVFGRVVKSEQSQRHRGRRVPLRFKCYVRVPRRKRRRQLGVVSYDGERTTPKKFAQDVIMDQVSVARGYWEEKQAHDVERMTNRERRVVADQLKKQADRIARMFGYDQSWSS